MLINSSSCVSSVLLGYFVVMEGFCVHLGVVFVESGINCGEMIMKVNNALKIIIGDVICECSLK